MSILKFRGVQDGHTRTSRHADQGKWRILIPDGDSPFALLVAQCLKHGDPSIRVHAAYVDPRALTRFSRYVDRCFSLPATDTIEHLSNHLKASSYDLILPVSGPGMAFVTANLAQLSPLARIALLPESGRADLVSDKWTFYLALKQAGIPTPKTVLVDDPSCADRLGPGIALLLKPRHGSGGQGIIKFKDSCQFKSRAHEFIRPNQPYILQHYIEGHDVDRSLLAQDGRILCSTIQKPLFRHGFAPVGTLHFQNDHAVGDLVDRLIALTNWTGIAHIDLRYDHRTAQPMVIEMNPRYWSSLIGSLVAGVNFPLAHVRTSIDGQDKVGPQQRDVFYVNGMEWPSYFLKHGTPLSHSSLYFNLTDPVAKIMKWMRPSISMGSGGA